MACMTPHKPDQDRVARQEADAQLVLLPDEEVAALLHKSIKTLERWRTEGFGPCWIRVGRKPLYRQSDLIAWLDANTVNSTSEEA